MARLAYTDGPGSPYARMLGHSPATRAAVAGVRDAVRDGTLPARLRVLSTLTADLANQCHY